MMKFFGLILLASLTLNAAEDTSASASEAMKSYMSIEPKARALDYSQAFDMLRKEKATGRVFFKTKNGDIISNIIDLTLMNNGTLIFFRYNTSQGIKHQVVNIEEIVSLSHY